MRSKAILLALLAFVSEAQAVPVSQAQAERAARSWVARSMRVRSGRVSGVATRHLTTRRSPFYVVKMSDGGSVFVSADTKLEPVIAFTSSATDFSTIDERSPLWALLNRDVSARHELLSQQPKASLTAATPGASGTAASGNEAKWAKLLAEEPEEDEDAATRRGLMAMSAGIMKPASVRVDKLVESAWDQSTVGSKACYNYYTPTSAKTQTPGDANNAVCGCVATAMAQVMRYHEFPSGAVTPVTRDDCFFDTTKISLTMQGGSYDWANMPLAPTSSHSDLKRSAIGKLTSDAGVSVGMMYSKNDSGSWSHEAKNALANVFGYRQVRLFKGHSSAAAKKALYANFDAGLPVILGISNGSSGHEIVGDGYGYTDGTPYVHLNMGWSGQFDLWYNLPDVVSYDSVDEIIYNIMPSSGNVILSGRVIDEDDQAVAGVTVVAYASAAHARQADVQTDAHGIYAFVLPAGTYDIEIDPASAPGKCADPCQNVVLSAPSEHSDTIYGALRGGGTRMITAQVVTDGSHAGNSWGNDIWMRTPAVQIQAGGQALQFPCLDKALEKAAELYAADPSMPIEVEVIQDTELRSSCVVAFPCVIRSEGGSFCVTRNKDAALTVDNGGELKLEQVAFSISAVTLATVDEGGCFVLGANVDMGIVGTTVASVKTADATGFVLAAPLVNGFAIDCAVAHGADAQFGRVENLTPEQAELEAAKIVNVWDEYAEIRGKVQGDSLVWGDVPVPVDQAVGYYVGADGSTNTAARLDRLFPKFMNALNDRTAGSERELVITESGELSGGAFTNAWDFTLRGLPGVVISNSVSPSTVCFVITNGTMTVRNLTFSGFKGGPFIVVNGANAGVVLERGAKLANIVRLGKGSDDSYGPMAVLEGAFAMNPGSEIIGCDANATAGGGVYLKGQDCRLTVDGGVISNCHAKATGGGGVYAGTGSTVSLSGASTICNNTFSSPASQADDVYLGPGVRVDLAGAMVGGRVGIRASASEATVNMEGGVFVAASSLSGTSLAATAKSFFNDVHPEFAAVPGEGGSLKWTMAEAAPEHQPLDPSQRDRASARVIYANGTTELWESALWAFEALSNYTGSATVELLKDDSFDAGINVCAQLTVRSESARRTFSRAPGAGIVVAEGGSLTVTNLVLKGVYADSDEPSTNALVKASGGGQVVLQNGARIEGARGAGCRDANAVTVWYGSVFRMESGAEICGCTNQFVDVGEGAGSGGGLLVDNDSRAYLYGGRITGCAAYKAGGVSVANESFVYIGKDMSIDGNFRLNGEANNLQKHANSSLVLDAGLTAPIGYIEGVKGDKEVFGKISPDFSGTMADKLSSARRFVHDLTGAQGTVVTNETEELLVWGSAVNPDGSYTTGGKRYQVVAGGAPMVARFPTVKTGLVYSGIEQTGVEAGLGYVLNGNTGTDAGDYNAVAKLRPDYVWEETGTSEDWNGAWRIGKATYDMSKVVFSDAEFVYDGKVHFIEIPIGLLPDGVDVTYENDNQTTVGVYIVTATFKGDDKNYNPIENMTATLTIVDPQPGPGPDPDPPQTNYPTPIAFISINYDKESEKLVMVLTNGVKDCWYSLWGDKELKLNERGLFGTDWMVRLQAETNGPVTFAVGEENGVMKEDKQWFWRALGEPGEVRK